MLTTGEKRSKAIRKSIHREFERMVQSIGEISSQLNLRIEGDGEPAVAEDFPGSRDVDGWVEFLSRFGQFENREEVLSSEITVDTIALITESEASEDQYVVLRLLDGMPHVGLQIKAEFQRRANWNQRIADSIPAYLLADEG